MIGMINKTNFSHHRWVEANEMLIIVTLDRTTGSIKGKILRVMPRPWVGRIVFPLTTIKYSVAMPETVKVKLKALVARAKYVDKKTSAHPCSLKSSLRKSKILSKDFALIKTM